MNTNSNQQGDRDYAFASPIPVGTNVPKGKPQIVSKKGLKATTLISQANGSKQLKSHNQCKARAQTRTDQITWISKDYKQEEATPRVTGTNRYQCTKAQQ
jgi:hypothetical protein